MNFYFREASIEDAETLLEWRNDESTRKSSHNDEIIPLESHKSWLQEIIVSSDRFLYVVELDNESVGTVRKDRDENTWVISWTVSPSHRGMGIGKEMVKQFCSSIPDKVRAEVKKENISSSKIAEYAGMELEDEKSEVLFYFRN